MKQVHFEWAVHNEAPASVVVLEPKTSEAVIELMVHALIALVRATRVHVGAAEEERDER